MIVIPTALLVLMTNRRTAVMMLVLVLGDEMVIVLRLIAVLDGMYDSRRRSGKARRQRQRGDRHAADN
jgi:hypothetical protein